MKILLTGATGFVGNHLAKEFLSRGHELHLLVRRGVPDLEKLGAKIITGDLVDLKSNSLPDFDAVVHVAGLIKALKNDDYYRVNADGTEALVKALPNQTQARFVLVSSVSARGPGPAEGSVIGPVSHYGKSKLAGEYIAASLLPREQIVIVRPPVVYGPGDQATLSFFKMFKSGYFPKVLGHDDSRLSFIYVMDLVKVLADVTELQTPILEPIYTDDGSGGHDWQETLSIAGKLYNQTIRQVPIPKSLLFTISAANEFFGRVFRFMPMMTREKYKEMVQPHWQCSSDACLKYLPNIRFTSMSEGFEIAKNWYETNKWL